MSANIQISLRWKPGDAAEEGDDSAYFLNT